MNRWARESCECKICLVCQPRCFHHTTKSFYFSARALTLHRRTSSADCLTFLETLILQPKSLAWSSALSVLWLQLGVTMLPRKPPSFLHLIFNCCFITVIPWLFILKAPIALNISCLISAFFIVLLLSTLYLSKVQYTVLASSFPSTGIPMQFATRASLSSITFLCQSHACSLNTRDGSYMWASRWLNS